MSDVRTLEQVIADARGDAAVLRRHKGGRVADAIEKLADQVVDAARDYLDWLSEQEACLRSARSRAYFRSRFPEWETIGVARKEGRMRQYRAIIVPHRAHVDAAREAGRRAAHEVAA